MQEAVRGDTPIILWFRRDLRLSDHPALRAAADSGRPVIPVFIHDEVVEALGAAPKWRLGLGVAKFAETLEGIGSRLILRRGKALDVLQALVEETGAGAVWWSRAYDPGAKSRDTGVKTALKEAGIDARSFAGHLLFEPWTVETKDGGYYKVYTPFWRDGERARRSAIRRGRAAQAERACGLARQRDPGRLADGRRDAARGGRGGAACRRRREGGAGPAGALSSKTASATTRQCATIPARPATSGLSENLTYGEISPRTVWHAGQRALHEGRQGRRAFPEGAGLARVRLSPGSTTRRGSSTDNWRDGVGRVSLERGRAAGRGRSPGSRGAPAFRSSMPRCARCM